MPGVEVHVDPAQAEQLRPSRPGAQGEVPSTPTRSWIIDVDDLDASLRGAGAAGAEQVGERTAVPTMGWSACVRDPEGNVIRLWQTDPDAA